MKYKPIDIFTLLDYENWFDDFDWPENNNEIFKVRKIIEKNIFELYMNEKSELCKNLTSIFCNILIIEYLSLYRTLLIIERIKSSGKVPDAKKQRSLWMLSKGLLEGGRPRQSVFCPSGFKKDYEQSIKIFLYSLSESFALAMESKSMEYINWKNSISLFSTCQLAAANKKTEKAFYKYEMHWKWFPYDIEKRVSVSDNLLIDCVQLLAKSIIEIFGDNGLTLSQFLKDYIFELTYNYYKQTAKFYIWNRGKENIPKNLWMGTGSNYYNRLLAKLVRDKNGIVTCFEHGEPKSIYKDTFLGYGELGLCNRYMTYTKQSAELYKDSWADTIKLQNQMPKIITPYGCGKPYLQIVFKRYGKNKTISYKGKKVVYIANAFRNDLVSYYVLKPTDVVCLEWQRYLSKVLSESGYEIAFKMHPEGILVNRSFAAFEDMNYLDGKFEDILDRDNILIFDHTGSTALTIAVCTNKPIVLIDDGLLSLHVEARKHLATRCAIVDGYFDDKNRFRVEKDKLQEALVNASKSKNYDFSYRYLIGLNC